VQKVLIGTQNLGKLKEIRPLLIDWPIALVTPPDLGLQLNVPEEGSTYAENAMFKALVYARHSGLVTLADDSGLEVDALDGMPGLHSARYAPQPGATDADRRVRLLEALCDHPQPWHARFCCVVAIATPAGDVETSVGVCEGVIIPIERGLGGFGYDPIFLLPELERTMAELDLEEKNQISHRARAVIAARPLLKMMLAQ
jgi:XTP/dITP diphosphohydrolase